MGIEAVELRHLRYFLAVAEERHFGRAAKRLRIAQPPLSRQIQALEAELRVALFDRGHRRIELTTAGEAFLTHARRIFDAVDLAVDEAQRAAAGKVGRIAIGYPSSVAFSGLPELLRAFRARSPGVEVALRELPPQEQVEALLGRRIDVGFIRGAVDGELASRRVRSEPLLLALPKGHALAARARGAVDLGLCAREPFVCFPRHRGAAFFDQLMRVCHDAGFTPRIVQEAPQLDIVSLVAGGFGVAIVPGSLKKAKRPGVVFRTIAGSPRTELFVAWRPRDSSPVVRDFLDVVDRAFVRDRRATARRRGARQVLSARPAMLRPAP
ncbi:MAG TPA: LysR substrate-binding domain-containing protein [Minicystis sp.]|nr:LysR substrate-binding domain-containing protein [Minicystis sp.]